MANANDKGASAPDQMTKEEWAEKYGNITKENFTRELFEDLLGDVFSLPGGRMMVVEALCEIRPDLIKEIEEGRFGLLLGVGNE